MHNRVGANIDSWCTKCKLILAHTIEAMVGQEIKRVACNTCASKHIFRAYEPGRRMEPIRRERVATMPQSGSIKASDYERLLTGRDLQAIRAYTVSESFTKNDLLSHGKFGLGLVLEQKSGNKIEVMFPDGPKTLIHQNIQ